MAIPSLRDWDHNFVTDFISIVETHKCLWDRRNNDGFGRVQAYQALQQKMQEYFSHATIDDAKKKVEFLKGVFKKEMKSASRTDDPATYRSNYWYFGHLGFLNCEGNGRMGANAVNPRPNRVRNQQVPNVVVNGNQQCPAAAAGIASNQANVVNPRPYQVPNALRSNQRHHPRPLNSRPNTNATDPPHPYTITFEPVPTDVDQQRPGTSNPPANVNAFNRRPDVATTNRVPNGFVQETNQQRPGTSNQAFNSRPDVATTNWDGLNLPVNHDIGLSLQNGPPVNTRLCNCVSRETPVAILFDTFMAYMLTLQRPTVDHVVNIIIKVLELALVNLLTENMVNNFFAVLLPANQETNRSAAHLTATNGSAAVAHNNYSNSQSWAPNRVSHSTNRQPWLAASNSAAAHANPATYVNQAFNGYTMANDGSAVANGSAAFGAHPAANPNATNFYSAMNANSTVNDLAGFCNEHIANLKMIVPGQQQPIVAANENVGPSVIVNGAMQRQVGVDDRNAVPGCSGSNGENTAPQCSVIVNGAMQRQVGVDDQNAVPGCSGSNGENTAPQCSVSNGEDAARQYSDISSEDAVQSQPENVAERYTSGAGDNPQKQFTYELNLNKVTSLGILQEPNSPAPHSFAPILTPFSPDVYFRFSKTPNANRYSPYPTTSSMHYCYMNEY